MRAKWKKMKMKQVIRRIGRQKLVKWGRKASLGTREVDGGSWREQRSKKGNKKGMLTMSKREESSQAWKLMRLSGKGVDLCQSCQKKFKKVKSMEA